MIRFHANREEMIRTHVFPCRLPKDTADRLNRESGRIYTGVLVEHYRILRHLGHWLSPGSGEKLSDYLSTTFLHAHSRDAAQQGFYQACKTAHVQKSAGMGQAHYPHLLKTFCTSIWKNTGIRKKEQVLLLALARGNDPIRVSLPTHLVDVPAESFLEMRLVWDRVGRRYNWHCVVEDGLEPANPPGDVAAAADLGEVHPAAVTDGKEGMVFSARALRSLSQYTNKRLAEIQSVLSKKEKHSRRYQRLVARKSRFLAKQKRKRTDIEHKVSRSVVDYAVESGVGTLVIGDVRDAADGVDYSKKSNQKISNWSHGKVRGYLEYKAVAAGIQTMLVNEAYTSKTCPNPNCLHKIKPRGRVYRCPACGFVGHRDIVGASNILSRHVFGKLGQIYPADTKYRHPFNTGKRSPVAKSAVLCGHPGTGSARPRSRRTLVRAEYHQALYSYRIRISCVFIETSQGRKFFYLNGRDAVGQARGNEIFGARICKQLRKPWRADHRPTGEKS
jgi:putative transposase